MPGMDLATIKNLLTDYYKHNTKEENVWSKYMVTKNEVPGVFRIVPYRHGKHPFLEIKQHWDVGGEKTIICPKHLFGTECPICDLSDKFLADASFKLSDGMDRPEAERKNNWSISRSLRAVPRYFSPVLSREHPELGVRLIGYSEGNYLKLLEFANDPDCGDFVDPISGRDVAFSVSPRVGGKGNTISVTIKLKESSLSNSETETAKLIDSVPNYFELDPPIWKIKTKNELIQILSRVGKEQNNEEEITISSNDESTEQINVTSQLSAYLKNSSIVSNEIEVQKFE